MKKVLVFLIVTVALLSITSCNLIHTHSFGEWSVTKNPTCTEDGVKTRYCDCGEKNSDVIPAIGHNYVEGECAKCVDVKYCKHENLEVLSGKEATCIETGLTDGKKCSSCDKILVEQETIPAFNHIKRTYTEKDENCNIYNITVCDRNSCDFMDCSATGVVNHAFGEWEHVNSATGSSCGIDKIYKRICADCGATEDRVEPTPDHNYSVVVISTHGYNSTTGEATVGVIEYTCQNTGCDSMYYEYENHQYTQSVISSTCGEQGYMVNTCSCGHSYCSDFTEKLPHTLGADATCTTAQICTKCREIISPALGHIWGEWEESLYSSSYVGCLCEKETLRVRFCRECGVQDEEYNIIPAPGHDWKEATCTDPKTCHRAECKVTDGEPKGHNFSEWVTVKEATTTEEGLKERICICGEKEIESIPVKYSFGLKYTLNSDEKSYSVIGIGTCDDTDIIIPDSYNGRPVTNIDENAFKNNTAIKYLFAGNNVISIGVSSFEGCTSLETIIFPDNVISVGDFAFANCSSLVDVQIGKGFRNFPLTAFYYCFAMSNIQIHADNPYYSSNDGNCYNKEKTTLIRYSVGKKDSSFVIPDTVKVIGDQSFYGAANLLSVTISNNITSIGHMAFDNCIGLSEIHFEGTVAQWKVFAEVSGWADHVYNSNFFIKCSNGELAKDGSIIYYDVDQQGLVFTLDADGKSYSVTDTLTCNNECVIIPGMYNGLPVTSIDGSAFNGCSNISSIVIPDTIETIGGGAFNGCSNLCTIIIPNKVKTIYAGTFAGCFSLTSVVIPDSITSIQGLAFVFCSSLVDVYYTGSEEKWEEIAINSHGNEHLTNATIHYNYVPEN